MTRDLILHYAPDNASLCVRMLPGELGLHFETRLLDRAQRGQKPDAFLALNSDAPSLLGCYLAPILRWAALYGDVAGWQLGDVSPRLLAFARRFETRVAIASACVAEGLGPTPISNPHPANPPEGSPI